LGNARKFRTQPLRAFGCNQRYATLKAKVRCSRKLWRSVESAE
jgi:DNA polymerase II large subunit